MVGGSKMFKSLVLIIFISLFTFIGCSKDSVTSKSDKAILNVYIRDSAADYESVYLTINFLASRVTYDTTGNITMLYNDEEAFDFASLRNGNKYLIASKEMPIGSIGSIRIFFGSCWLTLVDDTTKHYLTFRNSSDIIMDIEKRISFSQKDDTANAVIDINLWTSIEYDSTNGIYYFEPDISLMNYDNESAIYGIINPRSHVYLINNLTDEILAYTLSDLGTGQFGFYGLSEGFYDVKHVPWSYFENTYDTLRNVYIPIYPGVDFDMGTIDLPELGG
jgi:hypothetical protein